MKSKFPGMDPFLEAQEWEDFHTTFNTVLREHLGPSLEPEYPRPHRTSDLRRSRWRRA
jgi:hypothetical protein